MTSGSPVRRRLGQPQSGWCAVRTLGYADRMELDVNGTIIANPSAADIARALEAKDFPADWHIKLANDAGASLDAQAEPGGTFHLSFGAAKRPPASVDAATVEAVYLDFLAGTDKWHAQGDKAPLKFVPDTRPLKGYSGEQPPRAAIIVMIGVIGLVALTFAIEHASPGAIRDNVPFGDSDFFWIGLIFLPLVALVVMATASKLIERRRAQSWEETTGRIVRSEIKVQRHQFAGEPETVKSVPAVEYEFRIGKRTIEGTRISIGDDAGGANLEATLKRYPVGASVSVYYDPTDPRYCVLERAGPNGLSRHDAVSGPAGGLALLAFVAGALYWVVAMGPDFVRAHFSKAAGDPALPLGLVSFGLVLLLFFIGVRRASKQAMNWRSARGKILRSEVESYEERDSDGKLQTFYRPVVEFSYPVDGREYYGDQIKLGLDVSADKADADKMVATYAVDSAIDVHYDPADPTAVTLENPTDASWVVAVLALGCFVLAGWQLGIVG